MCGIAALFAYGDALRPNREELLRTCDRMVPRGPDGTGEWTSPDQRVALGHRRLAIIDLSDAGAQPMWNEDGSLVIVCNGEIYNYRELRDGLVAKGVRFRSGSDTEVLLQLYSMEGDEMLDALRGMYAFAIWDARKQGLFIARDPFGIKPLYISDDGNTVRVASQVKALLAGGGVDTSPEPAGHVGFYLWGHVPEPYTLYKGIRAVTPGTSLWVDADGKKEHKVFCSIPDEYAKLGDDLQRKDLGQSCVSLRQLLLDSVRHHLVADVPVGVFLSAGLDSTTLAALASEIVPGTLNSITLGFREYQGTEHDETPLAELVARHYGATHQTVWVERSVFLAELPKLLDAMDQPTTDGVNSYFVSYAAARTGLKVALSGLGGDEIFGSYPSFQQIPRMVAMMSPPSNIPLLGKTLRAVTAPVLKCFTSPKYAGLLEYGGSYGGAYLLRRGMFMPWELPDLLDGEMVREGWRALETMARLDDTVQGIGTPRLKVSALESCWYMRNQLLRDTDWASMAHSLEIRVPLVDIPLLRGILPMLSGEKPPTKRELGETPATPLPTAVSLRKKTGFSIPVNEWVFGRETAAQERGARGWAKRIYKYFVAV